jgi:hypothetical protein
MIAGRPLQPFRYVDKGIMATIGRNSAVVQAGRLQIHGFPGWLAWLGIHLLLIVSLESKLQTMTSWAYNYFFFDRPLRLIIRPTESVAVTSSSSVPLPEVIRAKIMPSPPTSPERAQHFGREDREMGNQFGLLRMIFLAVIFALVVLMVWSVNSTIGVNHAFMPPHLSRDEQLRYVPVAAASVLFVIIVDVGVASLALRKLRRERDGKG